jgi:hypothetical protein
MTRREMLWVRCAVAGMFVAAAMGRRVDAQSPAGSLEISVSGRVQFYSPELLLPRTILTRNFPTGRSLVEGLPVFPGQPAPTSGFSDGATVKLAYAVRKGLQGVAFFNTQGQPAVKSTEIGGGLRFEQALDNDSGLSYQVGGGVWKYTLAPYTGIPRKSGAPSAFYGGGESSHTGLYGGIGWWQSLGRVVLRVDGLVQSVGGGDERRRLLSSRAPTGYAVSGRDLNYAVEVGMGYRLFR